jgi:hypothetical protein
MLYEETDPVWPSSIGALKFGMKALQLEDSGGEELRQSEAFWQKCYQILNQGIKQNRGAIRPKFSMDFPFSAGSTSSTH